MDVMVWLRSLGLGKYEAAFRENDIDETVLPGLTHETLKELGVASIGHRVKLLDAIAALRSDASGKTPSGDATTTSSASKRTPEDRAERRQVTVMFSDLVGSTALSARIDPEDLRDVISAYQKCVAETVDRFGGFVAKFMGDGVLIYFGYPQAHEDDAERAVRAGLELVAAVGDSEDPRAPADPRRHRDGIGGRRRSDRVGRCSGASNRRRDAEPCGTLAGRCRAEQRRDCRKYPKARGQSVRAWDLGAQDLKGIAGPVRAWAAVRAGSAEGRFEAMHATGLTDLVGREEELELSVAALVEGKDQRRPSGVAVRRGRYWKVSIDGSTAATPCR